MAVSFNRVLLMGNLTRDPELRYVPSGMAVCTFTMAINRIYSTQSGEKKDEVTYVRIVVWGKRGEVVGQYLSKGSPVFVEGRLRTRSWQTPEGQNRSTTEVVADNIQFLRLNRGQQSSQEPAVKDEAQEIDLSPESPIEDTGSSEITKNDDIPF